jgi:hypothetical protein
MRKTLLLFTTMALALLLAAGTAWAALPAPTVVSTVPPNGTTGVITTANITATFSEAMSTKSLGICNHCTSTSSSKTFYLLKGNFTAPSEIKNPPRSCTTIGTRCPDPITSTVSYTAATNTATLDPSSTLLPGTEYTAVVEGTSDGDFVAVKDTGGTPVASDYIWHFTTGSVSPTMG